MHSGINPTNETCFSVFVKSLIIFLIGSIVLFIAFGGWFLSINNKQFFNLLFKYIFLNLVSISSWKDLL